MLVTRYSKALIQLAFNAKEEANVIKDAEMLEIVLKDKKVRSFFVDRMIPARDRMKMFEVSPVTMDFLRLVIENKREQFIGLMMKDFIRLYDERMKIAKIKVVSSIKLDNGQTEELKKALENRYSRTVEIENLIDISVLGVKVMYEDKILDGTVLGRLKEMSKMLIGEN